MDNLEEKTISEVEPKKNRWPAVVLVAVLAGAVVGGVSYFSSKSFRSSNSEAVSANVVDISAKPFEFSVKEIRVKKGEKVKINLSVAQGMHDWVVDEFSARTKQITVGQSDSVEFVADKTGTFEYYCNVGTHRQMGMVGKLIVE